MKFSPIIVNQRTGSDPTLQALTVAISMKGIRTFFAESLTYLMGQTLEAPDKPSVAQHQNIPYEGGLIMLDNLDLKSGSVSQIKAQLTSVTPKLQDGNSVPGTYLVDLTASFYVAYSEWHETGTIMPMGGGNLPFDQTLGDFNFTVTNSNLGFDVQIAAVGNTWTIQVMNPRQSDITISDHLPKLSNLNDPSLFGCINDLISQHVAAIIQSVDYASILADKLNKLIGTVPESGHLTDSIIYYFPPTNLSFGHDGSIQAGISGAVTSNGTPYGGAAVNVPLAPVTDHDLHVYAGNYEFNALLWAFYENGSLDITVTPQMLPDPSVLNTGNPDIKNYLPELYNFAPDADIYLEVAATQPPTVSNGNIYVLTKAAADNLELPPTTRQAIAHLVDALYKDLAAFKKALINALSPEDYQTYGKAILDAVQDSLGLFTDTQVLVTVKVWKQEAQVFAFSFQVEKQDSLQQFDLSVNGSTQTIAFAFREWSSNAQLVKSAIGDIKDFSTIWFFANFYLNVQLQQAGTTGIPLPFIKGFYFDNATITLFDQNVGVDADVHFETYLQSIRRRARHQRAKAKREVVSGVRATRHPATVRTLPPTTR